MSETLKSTQIIKTKDLLAKTNGFKIGRVSLSSNIDTKLDTLIETPLPVLPAEPNLPDTVPSNCDDRSCKVLYEA